MIHPPAFVIQMRSTWRSHIPKARGNRRSDTSTQTLGTPKRPKERGREGGAIVFQWVYMCVSLRNSVLLGAVPLPLLVIPPIMCLSLPLSLPSVPLRITGVCQSPIREGCWVMGENRSALLWSPGPHSTRLPHTHTKHILTPQYKHGYIWAQRRKIYMSGKIACDECQNYAFSKSCALLEWLVG